MPSQNSTQCGRFDLSCRAERAHPNLHFPASPVTDATVAPSYILQLARLALWLIAALGVAWILAIGALYVFQRELLYPIPRTGYVPAAASNLSGAEDVTIVTRDGEHISGWYAPAHGERPLIVFFHGNAETVADDAARLQRMTSRGFGVLAIDYRGYGGSTGQPTEQGLLEDARATFAFAARKTNPGNIVVWGYSLGTGPAIATAVANPVKGLVLEAPYTSLAEVAAERFPLAPVRLLMKDRMPSIDWIGRVNAPLLVIHGGQDSTIPIHFGRRVFEAAIAPKTFRELPEARHDNLDAYGSMDEVLAFIEGLAR
jgi:uncharacterized protein